MRASYLDRGESHLGKALTKCSLYNKLPGFVVPKSDRALCVNNGNLLKAVNLFFSSSQARKIRQSTQCISSPKKTDAKIAKQLRTPQCISSTHFMPISHTPGVGPSPKSVQTPHLGASYVAVVGNIFVVNICVYTTFLNTKCTTYAQGHTHYLSGGPSLLWGEWVR